MNTVFFGTPEFAIPSLKALLASRHVVRAVVTAPDKPAGRGRIVRSSEVKKYAEEQGLPVLQPEQLEEPLFLRHLKSYNADMFLVVAYRILPEEVFSLPKAGTVNLHASLLPKYRGAAPIQWALINGEKETGVTTFFIERKVDTGEILLQQKVRISPDVNAGQLHDELSVIGADLLIQTVDGVSSGTLSSRPQSGEVTRAPKITKDMCRIYWHKSAAEIHNLVRGLTPVPGPFAFFQQKTIKILQTELIDRNRKGLVGEIAEIEKNGPILVQTGKGVLAVVSVQPEGKRQMSASEYIRGYKVSRGARFT
jgi:methionyl-tRNA formyltransferase